MRKVAGQIARFACAYLGELGCVGEARQAQVGQQLHRHAVAEDRERLRTSAVSTAR